MSPTPLVSIVLPTYNGSRYLAGAVESVRRQTHTRWELLIQDDASTDETPEIIRHFAALDPRILPATNPENLRLPRSLNAGFARASGRFLTWTSDDNEYRPEALEAMVSALESDPKAGLVYCDMTDMDDQGRDVGDWVAPEPEAMGRVNPVGACFLYRREVMESVGQYDDCWRLVEDWEYWMRVASQFPLRAIHRNLYRYRRHEASLTETRASEIRRIRMHLLEERLPSLPHPSRRHRAEAYLHLARLAAEAGDDRRESAFHRIALRADPLHALPVVAGRRLLGSGRAGAVRAWWRQRIRRPM
ncbi:MAG: glycosyltransferase family 2 protein [Verrucomicrobiae bacterium]|nr:glycosyltransferase family 2 protein [Verrucomicrobiae bacterium]